ncbi:hypothetical protein BVY03_04590 [bacterium K02(2017)]|nr:hypothetical protein BVY03_04590 [bacterium K02(2017)]
MGHQISGFNSNPNQSLLSTLTKKVFTEKNSLDDPKSKDIVQTKQSKSDSVWKQKFGVQDNFKANSLFSESSPAEQIKARPKKGKRRFGKSKRVSGSQDSIYKRKKKKNGSRSSQLPSFPTQPRQPKQPTRRGLPRVRKTPKFNTQPSSRKRYQPIPLPKSRPSTSTRRKSPTTPQPKPRFRAKPQPSYQPPVKSRRSPPALRTNPNKPLDLKLRRTPKVNRDTWLPPLPKKSRTDPKRQNRQDRVNRPDRQNRRGHSNGRSDQSNRHSDHTSRRADHAGRSSGHQARRRHTPHTSARRRSNGGHGYSRHNKHYHKGHGHAVHQRGHGRHRGHRHKGLKHIVHHLLGFHHNGLPKGHWRYHRRTGWGYQPWRANHHHFHHYNRNPNFQYHRDHHFYWHNHAHGHHFRHYPTFWSTHVVVIPPSETVQKPRYEGPVLDVSRLDKLKQSKWAIDRLAADLDQVPADERNTDAFRFQVKQILDNYHYLIDAVYDHASKFGPRHAKDTGPHHNPIYKQTVKDIWANSMQVLREYEAEFPFDSAMREDSVTVLYSNLAEKKILTQERWAAVNPDYVRLFNKVGDQIPR